MKEEAKLKYCTRNTSSSIWPPEAFRTRKLLQYCSNYSSGWGIVLGFPPVQMFTQPMMYYGTSPYNVSDFSTRIEDKLVIE
jgi:hypothetical protein